MQPAAVTTAVLARLATISGLTVVDGKVDTTPAGAYAVLYDFPPDYTGRKRLDSTATKVQWTAMVVCVGRDAAEARWVVKAVTEKLLNYRLPGADPSTSWVGPAADVSPVLRDDSVAGRTRFSQTLTYHLSTTRSPA